MSEGIDLNKVSDEHLDVFREIGNIGAGNAVTALATMLDKKIDMSVPQVRIVPFDFIANILDGPEKIAVGILVDVYGDLNGYILLVLGIRDALEMAHLAMFEVKPVSEEPNPEDIGELELSAINEISNIIVGSYLSAICSLTGLTVTPSVPHMAMDMVGAIMSIVAIEYGQICDSVLFMKTTFSDASKDITGHFFLIPDFESYKKLLATLGMEYKWE